MPPEFFQQWHAISRAGLAAARQKLLAARALRPRPHLDDKIITSWNGLMISAFARGAQVLDDAEYLASAQKAAHFIREHLWKDGQLLRSYRQGASEVGGFCDDYATLIQGLLDLYEADFDVAWLQWAVELQARQDALFLDPEHGGYFSVTKDAPNILLRMKEDYDGAEPSPNSVAALNLLRLAQITGRKEDATQAAATLGAFADQLSRAPTALPLMLVALDASLAKPRQIVIAGSPAAAGTRALLREVHAHFIPDKVLLLADGGAGQKWLAERLEFLKTVGPLHGQPAAYVCQDFDVLPVAHRRRRETARITPEIVFAGANSPFAFRLEPLSFPPLFPTRAMNVVVENLPNCITTLRVEVDPEKVSKAWEDVAKNYTKYARIPGYRAGKAPKAIIVREEISKGNPRGTREEAAFGSVQGSDPGEGDQGALAHAGRGCGNRGRQDDEVHGHAHHPAGFPAARL